MKNCLYVGFKNQIEWPPGGYLCILEKLPKRLPKPRHPRDDVRVFDPAKHSFNPLEGLTHARARELAELCYTISPEGANTLTVRNGRRALRDALMRAERFDEIAKDGKIPKEQKDEVQAMVGDFLFNPTVRRVLCNPTNFSFNRNSVILAKVSRAELGDFDALVVGLLLMSTFEGQVIVPDFGFYGRDIHTRLIREERLIAGVNHLSELPDRLRRTALLIGEKIPSATTVEDAEELARYERLVPRTTGFNDYVAAAIA